VNRAARALCALCLIASPLHGYEPPDHAVLSEPSDVDAWLEEGEVTFAEWLQLREWFDLPLSLREASPDELSVMQELPLSPSRDWGQDGLSVEPLPDSSSSFVYEASDAPRTARVRQRFTDHRSDGERGVLTGFVRATPATGFTVAAAESSGGAEALRWDRRMGVVREREPSRLTRGYVEWAHPELHAVAGDFSVGFGTGLAANTGNRRYPNGISPNVASTARQRGVAATWSSERAALTGFRSIIPKTASLSPAQTGLARSRSVDGALEERSAGARAELALPAGRAAVAWTVQSERSLVGTPILGRDPSPRRTFSVDAHGAVGGLRWRGEAAHAGEVAARLELAARGPNARLALNAYHVPVRFIAPLGSHASGRQGIFARGQLAPTRRARIGGQFLSEERLATATARIDTRVWFSSPIVRRIRLGGVWSNQIGNVDDLNSIRRRVELTLRTSMGSARFGVRGWELRRPDLPRQVGGMLLSTIRLRNALTCLASVGLVVPEPGSGAQLDDASIQATARSANTMLRMGVKRRWDDLGKATTTWFGIVDRQWELLP